MANCKKSADADVQTTRDDMTVVSSNTGLYQFSHRGSENSPLLIVFK